MIKSMSDVRREYGSLMLSKDQSYPEPYSLFEHWMEEILKTDNYDPTAMMLSTCDKQGHVDSRVVLLKGLKALFLGPSVYPGWLLTINIFL